MIICSHSNIDIIHGIIGYGDSEGITDWRISNTITNSNITILNISNSASNVRVSILENGNVGIGTTNPVSKIDIVGDANITGVFKINNRDVVNDTSNYILSTSNILQNKIANLYNDVINTSNYVRSTSNILENRLNNILSNSNICNWINISNGTCLNINSSSVVIGDPASVSSIQSSYENRCKLNIYAKNMSNATLTIQNKNIMGAPVIELIMGTPNDTNAQYKIGNYGGDFKIMKSISSVDTDYIRITSNSASIYNPTGSPQWSTVSDRRIKENIEKASYDICYDNINKLELYSFNYIKELKNINRDLKQLGYIAQEVQEIFPKAVSTEEFHNDNLCIPDMLSIDIAQINYSLYGAVKKLMEIDNKTEVRIKKIENLLNSSNI